MIKRNYFGTDGIRGKVGSALMTPEFAMRLGYAAGKVLVAEDVAHTPSVLLGKDTRISGYMLEAALQAGLTAAGVHVLLTGPIPTPAVAYLTRALRLNAGVMISASHNPFYDNGIKFFAEGGKKLSDYLEAEIEQKLAEPMEPVGDRQWGRARRIDGAAERYIEFCKSSFPNELSLHHLKLVVDCAHGAAYHIAPKVFHELGAEVIGIGVEPNGFNINDGVGATVPTALRQAVLEHQADYGIALDGDGDRLMMVDGNGVIYDGDRLLYVIARAAQQTGRLKGGVVGTVMTNLAMEEALLAHQIPFERTQVGDRYILERLQAKQWRLGGEASGHILVLNHHNTGDGIISALQVLAGLEVLGHNLAEVLQEWQPYPQALINVAIDKNSDWQQRSAAARAQVEAMLHHQGRVILRASGTEPVVRVMVEAKDARLAAEGAQIIAQSLSMY